jgi:hypothetical protein
MGRSLVILLIGLMEAALHQLWPSNVPKYTTSGESFRLGVRFPEETYPISEWSLSLWLYTTTSGTQVVFMNDPQSSLTWSGTYFQFRDNQKSNVLTTEEQISSKWVFFQLGSTAGMSYGSGTIRNGNKYFISSAKAFSLTATTDITLIAACGFSVITI